MLTRLSLKYQIALTIVILVAIVLALALDRTLSAFMVESRRQQAAAEQAILALLRAPSRQALLSEAYENLRVSFAQAQQDPHVLRVLLADQQNRIVLSTTPGDIGSTLHALTTTADRLWRITDIANMTGKLGVLAIEFSTAPLEHAQKTARNLGVSVAVTGLILIALAGVGMGFALTRRLRKLTRAAQRLAAGEGTVEAGLRGRDEVAQVGRAFDAMARQLAVDREQLEEREARTRAILDTSVDAIITIDEHGIIESFNAAAERMFGYRMAEAIGRNVSMLMPVPYQDEHDGYLAHYRHTGERKIIGIGREVVAQRKDGTVFPVDLAVSEVHFDDHRRFTGIVRDITRRKQAEDALQKAHDKLEQRVQERTAELAAANEDVRRFAYIVSHDLRAPLVNLKGFSAELRRAWEVLTQALPDILPHLEAPQRTEVERMLNEDGPEALEFIDASVSRMDGLIQGILNLSRAGRRELIIEPVKTEALVHDIVQSLTHQLTARQARVQIMPLPEVHADRTAMEQIFSNLISNAVKYLQPERPGEITVSAEQDAALTTFHIQDNGRGIAEDDIARVFELFRRVGRQDTSGEGMGLTYVQTLVRRHGGDIHCQSRLGVGTTFTFTISNHLAQGHLHAD